MLASRAELVGAKVQVAQTDLATIDAAQATADRLKVRNQRRRSGRTHPGPRRDAPGRARRSAAGRRPRLLAQRPERRLHVRLSARERDRQGRGRLGSAHRARRGARSIRSGPLSPLFRPMAQFTPKTVETAEERHNLTFRVKLQIDKDAAARLGAAGEGRPARHGLCPLRQSAAMAGESCRPRLPTRRTSGSRPGPEASELTDGCYARQWVVARVQRRHPALRQGGRPRRHQPRHSRQQDDRPDRAGRRRQVDPARHSSPACARSRPAEVAGARRRHRRRALSQRGVRRASPTCRRAWARTSIPRCRSSRTSISSAGCSANRARSASGGSTICSPAPTSTPFRDRPAGKLSGGMKQKLGPVLLADPRPRPADPGRTDHRRRSAGAPAILGADRPHPRCAARP